MQWTRYWQDGPTLSSSPQYLWIRYSERLAKAGITASVGSVSDSYDNALAETINGLYKTEDIRKRGPWRNVDEELLVPVISL